MKRRDGIAMDRVLATLHTLYTPPKTFLHFRTPLDLLVAVILSAQCTDKRVNSVTETILYPKYHTPEDYLAVSVEELEADIHSCGTYRMKAKSIRGMCRMVIEKYGGRIPHTMEQLLELPGVGRKTASVILSAVFDTNLGIAVDTHVQRLAQRLGLSTYADPKRIELDLMEQAPQSQWRDVTTLLISHGRAVCTARGRRCGACVFKDDCPSSLTQGKSDKARPKRSASLRRRST